MAIDGDLFRSVLGRFASGITVITTHDDAQHDHGMTASAFSSLSLDPPLVLVCIANDATLSPVMEQAHTFAVNVLNEAQESLSRRFAGKLDDRFTGIGFSRTELGDVLCWMQCRIVARHPSGDHVIIVGQVESADVRDGKPLLYYRGGYAQLER